MNKHNKECTPWKNFDLFNTYMLTCHFSTHCRLSTHLISQNAMFKMQFSFYLEIRKKISEINKTKILYFKFSCIKLKKKQNE